MEFVFIIGILGFFGVIMLMFVSRYILICHPNEVIVLSGRKRKLRNGQVVGYRMIRGGKAVRIPIIEKAARMSLNTIPLELTVRNAYSKGGIPLHVEGIANIKIDSKEPIFGNAVERFLDKPVAQIHKVAKDTLEGNLRGVVATLTPEEVNEDRLKFATSLIEEADSDLKILGLQLDTLKIQNVSDEGGYLDSIGRQQTADILSQARKAEAARASEAEQEEARSRQRAEVAKAQADQQIKTAKIEAERNVLIAQAEAEAAAKEARADSERRAKVANAKADEGIRTAQVETERSVDVSKALANQAVEIERNALRVKVAELDKIGIIKEMEAQVSGEKAKALYEQEMEQERILLQQRRLQADVIEPARAHKEAAELDAKGKAAKIIEDGEAQLRILNEMIRTYQSANGEGEKIFMLNMLPEIIGQLVNTVSDVKIDKVTVIDSGPQSGPGGGGNGIGRFINQMPSAVVSFAEQIENATGVNILSQFQKNTEANGHGSSLPKPKPKTSTSASNPASVIPKRPQPN